MLISPPFLPVRQANQSDDQYIATAMSGDVPGEGSYPVSFRLNWHGGLHLQAPQGANGRLPVRAIADGTVVLVRTPTERPIDAQARRQHPQGYYRGWTDNGVVVIRHETEIGEGADATVTFYSIYQHLRQIRPSVRVGRRTYRKEELGQAGYIYGQPDRIQLEIVCDDANLRRITGRTTGELSLSTDGRTDSVYGELYFAIPVGTVILDRNPQPPRPRLRRGQPVPEVPAPQVVHTTTEPLLVGVRYAQGDAVLTTYTALGAVVGTPRVDRDYEYNLYSEATRLYPLCPSAGYELLRFGRVLGPDLLDPPNAEHWRQVRYSGGEGWVNLNAAGVHKFSDADFPHWRGWHLIDDDVDNNSRCNSGAIIRAVDENRDGNGSREEAEQRLRTPPIQEFMKRLVCRFPTEWDASTVDGRYGWLRNGSSQTETADVIATEADSLDADGFERLRAHVQALSYWDEATIGITGDHWHFNPREFIRHLRQCAWMSVDEVLRCLPEGHGVADVAAMRVRLTQGITGRQHMPAGMYQALNDARNKYCIVGDVRTAQFLGQIAVETDRLQTVREYASGAAYEGRADLGNTEPGDGRRFRGRGVIQLTGRANYQRYEDYRGREFTTDPHPLSAETDALVACDASGFYWTAESTRDRVNGRWRLDGLININRRADSRTFRELSDQAAIDADVLNVTRQVNRAALHVAERRTFFRAAYFALSDECVPSPNIVNLRP